MRYSLFDIHSHLTFADFDVDRDAVIVRMKEEKIGTITVGTDVQTSKDSIALAEKHEHLFATVGIHPTHEGVHADFGGIPELARHPKVVAIGETGLDYYRSPQMSADETQMDANEYKNKQRELFEQHIELAHEHNLPLMIHARSSKGTMDAYEDVLGILENKHQLLSTKSQTKEPKFQITKLKPTLNPQPSTPNHHYLGNVHFFAGTVDVARRFLNLGFSLSFDGPITFASEYDEVIRFIPDDMIMAETDAPFAAPAPFRGKRNEPLYVRYIVEKIAALRGISVENCSHLVTKNALRCFKIPGEVV
jgi:TatD DNase family protein